MRCARLNLQERAKKKSELPLHVDKPRRYCQKLMVNPQHEEDSHWAELWNRFNSNCDNIDDGQESVEDEVPDPEDMVLTVQTLQFQGDVDQTKRPRTSFKYKTNADGIKHRMFVKEIVTENDYNDDDRSSDLTSYYFDDYIKYICSDRSRPTSSKSSILIQKNFNFNIKENKAIQVEIPQTDEKKIIRNVQPKIKRPAKKSLNRELKEEVKDISEDIENTKVSFQKTGKRKSLTISRAQSPETLQVIRVDVVCNYPSSSISGSEDTKDFVRSPSRTITKLEELNMKHNIYANKYLLTKSIKALDENVGGGSKVTLLCKTFKLTDRLLKASDKPNGRKGGKNRTFKDYTKNENTGRIRK